MEAKILKLFKESKENDGNPLFAALLAEYLDKLKLESALSSPTLRNLDMRRNNILRFLTEKGYDNLGILDVKVRHMEELRVWLKQSLKTCSQRHASLHLEYCRRVTRYAVYIGLLEHDQLGTIATKRDKIKEVIALTMEELDKLSTTRFSHPRLQRVADVFIFQCWTGLSYADLLSYKVVSKDGKLWITNQRQKNKNPYFLPMFPEAKRIHDQWFGKLPVSTNQEYNRDLKLVAMLLGFEKHLTTHVGRKTYASLRDQEGWSTRSIAQMLGNTIRICEQHYLAHSTKRVEAEFESINQQPARKA